MKKYLNIELCDSNDYVGNIEADIKTSEMSKFDRDFICGLIKKVRPQKIVEIGVAAGATTVFIWECLKKMDISACMYSIDLNENLWSDGVSQTGYIAKKRKCEYDSDDKYKFLIGDICAKYIDEIGSDIDFLILDTTHVLPGEILDFLVCLPYLKDGATVVMHDVGMNQIMYKNPKEAVHFENSYCTKVLFDTISADKYFNMNDENICKYPNISAFIVTRETRENIIDVFSALSLTWRMMPSAAQLDLYKNSICKNYDSYYYDLLCRIIDLQKRTYSTRQIQQHYKGNTLLLESMWREHKKVLIYGCGYWGKIYYDYAKANDLPLSGMIISDDQIKKQEYDDIYDVPVYHLSQAIDMFPDMTIVIGMVGANYDQCINNLLTKKFVNIL